MNLKGEGAEQNAERRKKIREGKVGKIKGKTGGEGKKVMKFAEAKRESEENEWG